MIPALSQVCSLGSPFEKDLEDYAAGECRTIELWLGKLETYLETHSLDDVRRLIEQYELATPVASFQGGLLTSQGDARREHFSHFARRLELCKSLAIGTLVIAGDVTGPMDEMIYRRIQTSLVQAAQHAAEVGVRLALEFQAGATLPNNLQTAASLIAGLEQPNLGLCLDIFHFYTGASKEQDLALLDATNLFHVQLCDLAGQARELATDGDRILPSDGDFQIQLLIEHLRRIGYTGCVSIELMNPRIWQIPARSFGEVAMTALRKVLGQASMGAS